MDQASDHKVFAVKLILVYLHVWGVENQRAQVLNAAYNNNIKGLQVWLESHHSVAVISCNKKWSFMRHLEMQTISEMNSNYIVTTVMA